VFIPRVGNEPVLGTIVNTITKNTDSMTTLITTRNVLIDTAGVSHEIFIDRESTFTRTVGGKLSHHISLTTNGVNLRSLTLVALEIDARIIDASLLASRSRKDFTLARIVTVRDVVVAARKRVFDTLFSDNTNFFPIAESARRITTIARTSTRAAVHIFSRKDDILTMLDALTIRHRFNSTESPAGTTITLITDHAHGLAVGPLLTSIEGFGSLGTSSLGVSTKRRVLRISPGKLLINTKKRLDLFMGESSSRAIKRSSPGVLDAVDMSDSFTSGETSRYTNCNSNKSNNELHF